MKAKLLSSLAIGAAALVATPASAQQFTGFTDGCFTSTTCTPTANPARAEHPSVA
jgi:hypothetical protein